MMKKKRWDSKYQQIEHGKGSLLGEVVVNVLKILQFFNVEDCTYESAVSDGSEGR
jgi:hypothetical protein